MHFRVLTAEIIFFPTYYISTSEQSLQAVLSLVNLRKLMPYSYVLLYICFLTFSNSCLGGWLKGRKRDSYKLKHRRKMIR